MLKCLYILKVGSKSLYIDILIRQTLININQLRLKEIYIIYLTINFSG